MATLKINFIFVIVAAVFISKALASTNFDGFKMVMKTMCNKQSEVDTQFSVLVAETFTNFQTCVTESLIVKNDGPYISKPFNSEVEKICHAAPSVIKCYHNLAKSFEFCLDKTQSKQIEKYFVFVNQLFVLMCSDQGQRIINIHDKMKCIRNRTDLESCVKKELDIIETFITSTLSELPSVNPLDNLMHKCTRIQEIETCIVEEISQCDDKSVQTSTENSPTFYSLENTTRKIFSLLKNVMECKNNKVQETQISTTRETLCFEPVVIIIYISLCMFIITILFIIIIISINRSKYIPYSHFDK